MSQYDPTFHLKINIGHNGSMNQTFDLKINVGHCDLYSMSLLSFVASFKKISLKSDFIPFFS